MSQVLAATVSLAPGSEKSATVRTPSSAPAPTPKLRSCALCRSRKVRCDKQSPCSNCRRANIACVRASTDRPPRWARRLLNNAAASNALALQEADPGVGELMNRVRNLENLVTELSGQLEQAHAAARLAGGASSGVNFLGSSAQDRDAEHDRDRSSATNFSSVQKQFGRLVLQDANRSRYVSSGFWSRVNDEVSRPVVVTPSSRLDGSLTFAAARRAADGHPWPGRR